MSDVKKYIELMRESLAYPGAHALYFPPDKVERHTANVRLAREFGTGLADSPVEDVDREIGAAYGQLIVIHSFDLTGVCIDAKEFVFVARQAEGQMRRRFALYQAIEAVACPEGGYSDAETDFVAPLQRAADEVAPGLRVRVLWEAYAMCVYHGDSQVVAVDSDKQGNIRVYDLPVRQSDEPVEDGYAHLLWLTLGCIADGACEPIISAEMASLRRLCEDDFNLYFERKPHD